MRSHGLYRKGTLVNTSLEMARAIIKSNTSELLGIVAQVFSDGTATSPNDLLGEKPSKTSRGKAWGAYLIYLGVEDKVVSKNIRVLAYAYDKIDTNAKPSEIVKQLDAFRAEMVVNKEILLAESVANGEYLTDQLDSIDSAVKAIESNPLYPTLGQTNSFERLLSRMTALQGSFRVVDKQVATHA